jgi:hypothetical protein
VAAMLEADMLQTRGWSAFYPEAKRGIPMALRTFEDACARFPRCHTDLQF